ncbi:MAG: HNH endonuclease [Burkholderiales bacterium]
MAKKFAADAAMSLSDESDSKSWWAGWKRHYWPADLLRRGFRFYTYDKQSRKIFALVEVVRGSSFTYRTLDEFARKVRQLIGRTPNRDNAYWRGLPRPTNKRSCTGYAIDWKTVQRVDIPWRGRFPQLGWARISSGLPSPSVNADQSYVEGDRKYRKHLKIERSSKLRADARDYWRSRLKGLRCLACGFSFERRYGKWGSEFVEMHHLVPLAMIRKIHESNVKKLVPLCANCHRMVHLQPKSPLTMNKLTRMLAANSRSHADTRKNREHG